MNIIQKCIDDVKYRIPKAILEKTFIKYNAYGNTYVETNIDELIRHKVIKSRVLIDCNLVGGTQELIALSGLEIDQVSPSETIVRIPKDRTQGKSINSVLHLSFLSPQAVSSLMQSNSKCNTATTQNASAMINALDSIPVTSTSNVQLIGENVILIRGNIFISPNCYLRCVLENDEELSNIQLRSYRAFSKLVEYAVKAYIYNEMIISLDQGQLQGGATLGIFKEIISSYADAEQNYQDYLKDTWQVTAFMNDQRAYSRYIGLVVGGPK